MRSLMLFASTYLFPAVGFPLVSYAWWQSSGSWPFTVVVMGAPVLFGYIMPGVATHYVKRWRFTSGPRLGSYYVHHGFIYGSKLALALLLVVRSSNTVRTAFDVVSIVLVTGAATAFGGWWHDLHAVRAGKIEVEGGPEALADFAPATYFSMGATYAGVALGSHQFLAAGAPALIWVFPAAVIILCLVPSLVFLAVDQSTRHALLGRTMRGDSVP